MPTSMPKYLLMTAAPIVAALLLPAAALAEDAQSPQTAKECISDTGAGFIRDGEQPTFRIKFQNDCDRAITCEIDAYVVGSRGPSQGHKKLAFEPRGQTPTTVQYTLPIKAMVGSAQYSRECKFK